MLGLVALLLVFGLVGFASLRFLYLVWLACLFITLLCASLSVR